MMLRVANRSSSPTERRKMRVYHFSAIIEKDKNGYYVSCPELQGCYTQGDTYEEALENIKDAVRLHVEDRIEDGEEVLQPESCSQ
jgi:predicted RNase H-like HicB family nuclease